MLDIDDTEDRVHGGQQLALFHAHYDSRCFLPIHIHEATAGRPVAVIFRPGNTSAGAEVARAACRESDGRSLGPRSRCWCAATVTTPGTKSRPGWSATASATSSGSRGTRFCSGKIADLAEDTALGRVSGEVDKVRRFGAFAYAAKSWQVERQVVVWVEPSSHGSDSGFVVTNLKAAPRGLYESVYFARGPGENLIKAHKLHFGSDPTSCTSATAISSSVSRL